MTDRAQRRSGEVAVGRAGVKPMSGGAETEVGALLESLAAAGTAERATREKAYLKSDRHHLGVRVPQVRALTRVWAGEYGVNDHDQVVTAAALLWERPEYECASAAVELLQMRRRVLTVADLPQCEAMIRTAGTWALVDPLATNIVWWIATRAGEVDSAAGGVLDRWAVDPDFWVRRAALLSQLRVVRDPAGDPSRFFGYAEAMLDETEFFIRKAIGWVLRDMGRRRPDEVFAWFAPRARRASGVTVPEVVKILDVDQRAAITASRA